MSSKLSHAQVTKIFTRSAYRIGKEKTWVAETHVLEERVELLAVKRAPWADKSLVKLSLVLAVLVV